MPIKAFLPFEEARAYARSLGLKGVKEWLEFTKSDKFPKNIPKRPETVYAKEWNGVADWLGTGRVEYSTRDELLPFSEAREIVRELGLRGIKEWGEYCKSGNKPKNIPVAPFSTYANEWRGFADWLGTGIPRATNVLPFSEAREIVRELGLRGIKEWKEYCKSGKLPENIPKHPHQKYRDEFKGYTDWLGASSNTFLQYDEAKKYIQGLGINTTTKWLEFLKSGKRPEYIPSSPSITYKGDWKGFADWVGSGRIRGAFLPYEKAREIVRKLELKNEAEWREYCKSGNKPKNIPSKPDISYVKEWKGMRYWLGVGPPSERDSNFLLFNEAREIVRDLGLRGIKEWKEYCKSGKLPENIPKNPGRYYSEWEGLADWLGCDIQLGPKTKKILPFSEAREIVRELGLRGIKEWKEYCKSGKLPENIPKHPHQRYRELWTGYSDWLGCENRSGVFIAKKFLPFEDAREYARSLRLSGQKEWLEWARSDKRPASIPSSPYKTYREKWVNLADWLGTTRTRSTNFLSFQEAREFVRKLGLKSQIEWEEWVRSDTRPDNIPSTPHMTYRKEWIDIFDWLGNEDTRWTTEKVKELLKHLIDSGIIYSWTEARLYSFLLRKGVLNLQGNKHLDFFRNLIRAGHTRGGLERIKEYANSGTEDPPDISLYAGTSSQILDETVDIPEATDQQISALVSSEEETEEIRTVEQILKNTEVLESISVDEEAMQFYVNYEVSEIWKKVFDTEEKEINYIKSQEMTGNKYHDLVLKTFLDEYSKTKALEIPQGYSFRSKTDSKLVEPFLMQRYVAYKIKNLPSYGNFSGTGAGKTLSAILASRVINSKLTLIVCPNDVVDLWETNIAQIFDDSKIIIGKDVFDAQYDEEIHQYLILNYDKLNQEDSGSMIRKLVNQKIDFVILDEVHFSKITQDESISLRRKNLDGLLVEARRRNSEIKILGLSATPVVNNLKEGKSLIELITGKEYHDIVTRPTVPNAVALYEKLTNISIRQIPNYDITTNNVQTQVEARKPDGLSLGLLHKYPLAIEQHLTNARIPEIIKRIDGQTVIYTEYVGTAFPNQPTILEKLSKAVKDAGFTFGLYTGEDHSGLKRFLEKKIQVLIASRPISTGVDGLQNVCNNLIFNTLPWTHALYQQIVGRVIRTGQTKKEVNIHHIIASIGGFPYDENKQSRLRFKRTLADCAVDGKLPEKNLVTPQRATQEAINWLERLERGEISCITRKELDADLPSVEIEKRRREFGDFSQMNRRINTEKSQTTHTRILANPEEWHEYHRLYRESRKTWTVIPYQEWISRLEVMSKTAIIGDFGCGEAEIAKAIGSRVKSFDHVSIDANVESCDMSKVPLNDGTLDIAIFSLSLMGVNWRDYLLEAKRCLVISGHLLISETTQNVNQRLSDLRSYLKETGFGIYKDDVIGDFVFIESIKL